MKNVFAVLLTLMVLPVFSAELKISGSTTIRPVLEKIAQAYMRLHPEINITINKGASTIGIQQLINKKVDIAMSSRYINTSEIVDASRQSGDLIPFHIAYDAIIPVVNSNNPITSLSMEQLTKIYRGTLQSWQEAGGKNEKIKVFCRDKNSGTQGIWNNKLLKNQEQPDCHSRLNSNRAVTDKVRLYKNAIGYVSLAFLSANSRIKLLKIAHTMGSSSCVKKGCYPLSRTLFLFSNGWPKPEVLNFINYVLHPKKGQKIIEESGFISLY